MSEVEFDKQYLWHPYASMNVKEDLPNISSGEGIYLYTSEGKRIIDGMSSWWCTIHGYSHPRIVKAAKKQLDSLSHVMFGGLTHNPAVALGKLLHSILPDELTYIFYADSGSIAVEVALKMAIQYWKSVGNDHKLKIATVRSGYHGDTLHAMSVSDPENGMHHLFKSVVPEYLFATLPPRQLNESLNADDKKILKEFFDKHHHAMAAFIIEPVLQGAGGFTIYASDYLDYLFELCQSYDVLLIYDEIATGFGRTGKMFALEHSKSVPDIICLGKALTGGHINFAATICNEKVKHGINSGEYPIFMHGPTFMASPLPCSMAIASIQELLSTNWELNVNQIEQVLQQDLIPLKEKSTVKDVRVLGAVGVVEFNTDLDRSLVQDLLLNEGVWLRPYGPFLYTMPPYIIQKTELRKITNAIIKVVNEYN